LCVCGAYDLYGIVLCDVCDACNALVISMMQFQKLFSNTSSEKSRINFEEISKYDILVAILKKVHMIS